MHSIDRNGVSRKLGQPPGRTGGAVGLWVGPDREGGDDDVAYFYEQGRGLPPEE